LHGDVHHHCNSSFTPESTHELARRSNVRLYKVNRPRAMDVRQPRFIGNCWLAAGFQATALKDPRHIARMLPIPPEGSPPNEFRVELPMEHGTCVHVVVDANDFLNRMQTKIGLGTAVSPPGGPM
jgi:hypothetical protein